jgi:hypothetical protein
MSPSFFLHGEHHTMNTAAGLDAVGGYRGTVRRGGMEYLDLAHCHRIPCCELSMPCWDIFEHSRTEVHRVRAACRTVTARLTEAAIRFG